ncbi:hypothetical protein NDU88_001446 [Pleurodeles waltl]|uniref:Uncharacterized protein n=1 Tax=Pleurodeles waltl TaxID=8319 RepID=A0AAV7UUP8_PLEWA|nr:hypothetical protein NDU88_001446 [Pleurodeles waltl]
MPPDHRSDVSCSASHDTAPGGPCRPPPAGHGLTTRPTAFLALATAATAPRSHRPHSGPSSYSALAGAGLVGARLTSLGHRAVPPKDCSICSDPTGLQIRFIGSSGHNTDPNFNGSEGGARGQRNLAERPVVM